MFSFEEIHGGDDYVPYISLDPLNDPQSFTFRIKVKNLSSNYKGSELKVNKLL